MKTVKVIRPDSKNKGKFRIVKLILKPKLKNMCKIDINGVKITLTKKQLAQIDQQRANKPITIDDINSIEDAEKVLEEQPFHLKYTKENFCRHKDWVNYQLETLAKAINFIYNGRKEWKLKIGEAALTTAKETLKEKNDFYYPYFRFSSGGWVCYGYHYYFVDSVGVVAFFPLGKLAENFGKKFIHLYREILPFPDKLPRE